MKFNHCLKLLVLNQILITTILISIGIPYGENGMIQIELFSKVQ